MDKTRAQILGENLKRIRKEKGYSRKELADVIGVNVDAIGKYETGQREPPLEKIFKLATFLEISMASLIGENDYSTEIPNIAAIVDNEIFEYRYQRALKITSTDFLNPTFESDDGDINVYIPAKVVREQDGALTFFADKSGITGHYIAFRNKNAFVTTIEKAEQLAVASYIPFYQALKNLIENIIKKP